MTTCFLPLAVHQPSPRLDSQAPTIVSSDAAMSTIESSENANKLMVSLSTISKVCRRKPLLAFQIFTVRPYDADASSFELCEKATELLKRSYLPFTITKRYVYAKNT